MKLLLDTHVLLWVMSDDAALSDRVREMLARADEIHVSSISLWEVAIKSALGKLRASPTRLEAAALAAGFRPLPVTWVHALAVNGLPPHHRDPFDRMLVAQAIAEPLHLITSDAALAAYGPQVVVV